jgi:hypothetical protein
VPPHPSITAVLIREKRKFQTQKHTTGKSHLKMKAEIGVLYPQAKDYQRRAVATRS